MICVAFHMVIRDGEKEYGTPYIASIQGNELSDELVELTLMCHCAMPELGIDPNGDDYEIHDDHKIEAHNGDYRWVWIDSDFKRVPKEYFEILKQYGICVFENLKVAHNLKRLNNLGR